MIKNKPHRVGRSEPRGVKSPRQPALDALRGLAILLMIVDHAAYYLWDVPLAPHTIRIVTRLSMPLFCGLMGYFLAGRANINWDRFYQLCLAVITINLAFFSVHHKLEILASLLIAYILFICCRNWLTFAVLAVYLAPWDPTLAWFDYPLPIVIACVAQGMMLRRFGVIAALASGLLITLAAFVVPAPSVYVLFYVIPATWLIACAADHPQLPLTSPPLKWLRLNLLGRNMLRLHWLAVLGRYPLTTYLAQYYILFALTRW